MKILSIVFFVLIASASSMAQTSSSVILMDIVEVPVSKRAEAIYYFENNWELFRERALQKGLITSYRMLEVNLKDADYLELILTTEFSDETQYEKVEENFEPIMKEARPNGPVTLNEVKPADFRKLVSTRIAHVVAEPSN